MILLLGRVVGLGGGVGQEVDPVGKLGCPSRCGGVGIVGQDVALGEELVYGGVREDVVDDGVVEVVDVVESERYEVVGFGDRFGYEAGAVDVVAA